MAQGLDVETWCREGLVDLIDVDPLEESPGESSQDIRPYLDLGHRHGIPVIAGIGSTAFRIGGPIAATSDFSVITPGLKRARGLHYAGVDGIDTYETEVLAWTDRGKIRGGVVRPSIGTRPISSGIEHRSCLSDHCRKRSCGP
jgi:hypothetical protein